jgi:hypothetical protein
MNRLHTIAHCVECTHRDGSIQDHILVLKGEVNVEKKSRSKSRNQSSGARVEKRASEPKQQKQQKQREANTKKKTALKEDASYEDMAPRTKKRKNH